MSRVKFKKKSVKELTRLYTGIRHVIIERKRLTDAQRLMKKHKEYHEFNLQHDNVLDCTCVTAKRIQYVLASLKKEKS